MNMQRCPKCLGERVKIEGHYVKQCGFCEGHGEIEVIASAKTDDEYENIFDDDQKTAEIAVRKRGRPSIKQLA